MTVEPHIEINIRQLAAAFDDGVAAIWLCGSRANGETEEGADWDLVVFGTREVAQALELGHNFFGKDADVRFVDGAKGEVKRLWHPGDWEDFSTWGWTEISPTDAHYRCARLHEEWVTLGGEWVEAGTLSVASKRAIKLWPVPPLPAPAPHSPTH
jgi:predicted nucleotidyltransferase